MSCIRTVSIAAVVSFVIILPWMVFSNYSELVGIGTLLSAVAASFAAIFAGCSILQNGWWQKLDRTYSHSPTRNESFLKALDSFGAEEHKKKYPGMKLTQKQFRAELKKGESKHQFKGAIDEELVVPVANFWGQMASEYYAGLLDRKIAKELLWFRFMRFAFVFEKWLSDDDRMGTYDKTIELYEEWKKDYSPPGPSPRRGGRRKRTKNDRPAIPYDF